MQLLLLSTTFPILRRVHVFRRVNLRCRMKQRKNSLSFLNRIVLQIQVQTGRYVFLLIMGIKKAVMTLRTHSHPQRFPLLPHFPPHRLTITPSAFFSNSITPAAALHPSLMQPQIPKTASELRIPRAQKHNAIFSRSNCALHCIRGSRCRR